jgi:hypothetical protein
MMSSIATAVVALLTQLLPILSTSAASTVAAVINALLQIIPVVVQEATDLIQPIKNVIAALSANPASTADQMKTLQTLDKQCDDAFEAAAVAVGAKPLVP